MARLLALPWLLLVALALVDSVAGVEDVAEPQAEKAGPLTTPKPKPKHPAQKPPARHPLAQKPKGQHPPAQKPAAQKPAAQKPPAKKPAAKKPAAKKPPAKKPMPGAHNPFMKPKHPAKKPAHKGGAKKPVPAPSTNETATNETATNETAAPSTNETAAAGENASNASSAADDAAAASGMAALQEGSESAASTVNQKYLTNLTEGGSAAAAALGSKYFKMSMVKAFAALAKLAYCGPGPYPVAPYGTQSGVQKTIPASCGPACTAAGFSLGTTKLISHRASGQSNADFSYVSRMRGVNGNAPPADCVVAFRGTWVNPANTQANVNTTQYPWNTPSCKGKGCMVAGGPLALYDALKFGILQELKNIGCPPGSKLVVAGHSLGGQTGAVAMFGLQDAEGYDVQLSYLFEGTKPFNKAAVEVFESLFDRPISFFRVTHANDAVPLNPFGPYMHPGFQIWFPAYNLKDMVYCGTDLDAPNCGNAGIKWSMACRMDDNPSWKKCGPSAPYGGPHCGLPEAPAGNICNFAGNNKALFLAYSTMTCMTGLPMKMTPPAPTSFPGAYPPPSPWPTTTTTGEKPPTTTTTSMALLAVDHAEQDCFEAASSHQPLGIFGHYMTFEPDIFSCQRRCQVIEFCEFFTFYTFDHTCHVSGGWSYKVKFSLGAITGPKNCSAPGVQNMTIPERVALQQQYMRFVYEQAKTKFRLQYEDSPIKAAEPQSRPMRAGATAALSAAVAAVAASALTLAAVRSFNGGLTPRGLRRGFMQADDEELSAVE